MADKIAEAYAEVRLDTAQLEADSKKVPGVLRSLLSTRAFSNIGQLITGNFSGFVKNVVQSGYTQAADRLAQSAEKERASADDYYKQAKELSEKAKDKSNPNAAQDKKQADELKKLADFKKATADARAQQAQAMNEAGQAAGARAAMIVKGAAAVAAAAIAAIVAAANAASTNLKTDQMVRATGQAAGWSTEQLKHMQEQLRKNSSFSNTDIAGAQQALLKHPNIKGEQFDKALKTSADLAAVFGQELPAAAAELGSVLADPIKAADGALEKYGVLLNQVQQGEIRNAMAARDWAKAQEIVLGHLNKYKGAAEEASRTGVGGFEKLKNSLGAALQKIGGITGGFGEMAAKVAGAVDRFMQLETVQSILNGIHGAWDAVTGAISGFIERNRADFESWGNSILEIWRNVRDNVVAGWEAFVYLFNETLGGMGTSWSEIWGEMKNFVSGVFDFLSLITTDFGLTAKAAWLKIQLGFQNLWDKFRDILAAWAVAFESLWDAVGAGAQAAWDQIKEAFGGPKAKSIGQAMVDAWNKGLTEGARKYKWGDSDAAKQLRKELEDTMGEMERKRDEIRARRKAEDDAEAAKKAAKDKALGQPGKQTDYINTKPWKFEFVGFSDLYKQLQQSLYPSEAMQLQKAGVAAAQAAVNNGNEANKLLGDIKEGVGKMGATFR